MDPATGATIFRQQILVPSRALLKAMEDAQAGLFRPERENDELTRALGNPEKPGRTRGKGASVSWKEGFPESNETYRSRQRKKDREADRIGKIEADLAGMKKMVEELSRQRSSEPLEDPPTENNSQRKSSVASTEVRADDHVLQDDAPAPHYPVDDVKDMTHCELHMPMRNVTVKVADSNALPCLPGALHHGGPIPEGYARVTVDDVVAAYEDLDIDIATPEGVTRLGDVKRHIILWQKKFIKFPGEAPRPPTPPRYPSPSRSPASQQMPGPSPRQQERQSPPPPSPPQQARQPTPPPNPPPALKRKRRAPTSVASTTTRKGATKSRLPKEPKPVPKQPCDMTKEELDASVSEKVKKHFAPKQPGPKNPFDDKDISMLTKKWLSERPQYVNLKTDYDREIFKQEHKIRMEQRIGSARKKQIPQLGEQKKQLIPPLIVSSDPINKAFKADVNREFQSIDPRAIAAAKEMGITLEEAKITAAEWNMSLSQMFGYEDTPFGDVVRNYVRGEPLVLHVEESQLSTYMRALHKWYLNETAKRDPIDWFSVDVRKEHHFKEYCINVQLSELFQLYNQRALDKSLLGCYCL